MSGAALGVTLTIIGIIFGGGIPSYFLARQNVRAARDQRDKEVAAKVKQATDPLNTQLTERDRAIVEKDRLIDMYRDRVEQRDRRIEHLEDELRRAGR